MFGIGSLMPLPGWKPKPTPAQVAREFIAYYTRGGGCSNCGGSPHSDTCFVGRFIAALDEPVSSDARLTDSESGKAERLRGEE
jgi:hypothetical protein